MINTQSTASGCGYNTTSAASRLLWSRHQIIQLLERFIRDEQSVSVHYANEDKVIVTRAIGLDAALDRVYFEYGDHKAANSKLLASKDVHFSLENGEAQSQFSSRRVRDVLFGGKPVFHVPVPDRIVQCDRRITQRVAIPEVTAPVVQLNLPDGRITRGRLADMSADGIGAIGLETGENVIPGTRIQNCWIELHDGALVCVDVEIRHSTAHVELDGRLTQRVGFALASRPEEFSDLLNAFTVDL